MGRRVCSTEIEEPVRRARARAADGECVVSKGRDEVRAVRVLVCGTTHVGRIKYDGAGPRARFVLFPRRQEKIRGQEVGCELLLRLLLTA